MWHENKPTYQFSEGGNHPLHPVLLAMCICRTEMSHSGVESFDPVMYGGQPYKRQEGVTTCTGVFPARWSVIISCTCCTCVSAVFMFFLLSVHKPQPRVTEFTTPVCYARIQDPQECPREFGHTATQKSLFYWKREFTTSLSSDHLRLLVYVFLRDTLVKKSPSESFSVNNVEPPRWKQSHGSTSFICKIAG